MARVIFVVLFLALLIGATTASPGNFSSIVVCYCPSLSILLAILSSTPISSITHPVSFISVIHTALLSQSVLHVFTFYVAGYRERPKGVVAAYLQKGIDIFVAQVKSSKLTFVYVVLYAYLLTQ